MKHKIPFLLSGFACLLAGVFAGLAKAHLSLFSGIPVGWISHHALFWINGFFGTLIALERATAYRKAWAFLTPITAALGAFFLLFNLPVRIPILLFAATAAGLLWMYLETLPLARHFGHLLQTLGAGCWLSGLLLFILKPEHPFLFSFWMLFLVLTILGEREEALRLRPVSPALRRLGRFSILFSLLSAFGGILGFSVFPIFSLTLMISSATYGWLELSLHRFARTPFARYQTTLLSAAYFWLTLAGLSGLFGPFEVGSLLWDFFLHAVFLGFVFSMVFAHAPLLFPALTGKPFLFSKTLWVPVILFHGSLLFRASADIFGAPFLRSYGAAGNAGAILLFFVFFALGRLREKRQTA